MVVFNLERFTAVYFPLRKKTICTSFITKLAVMLVVLVGLSFNSVYMVTIGVETFKAQSHCVILTKWFNVTESILLGDILISMVIPFCIISLINTLIVLKLTNFSLHKTIRRSLLSRRYKSNNSSSNRSTKCENLSENLKMGTLMRNGSNASNVSLPTWLSLVLDPQEYRLKRDLPPKQPTLPEQDYLRNIYFKRLNNIEVALLSDSIKCPEVVRYISEQSLSESRRSVCSFISVTNCHKRKESYSHASRVLLLISMTFLALHFPIGICRLLYVIKPNKEPYSTPLIAPPTNSSTSGYVTLSDTYALDMVARQQAIDLVEGNFAEKCFYKVSNYFFYLNFGLNFFIYSFNGGIVKKGGRRSRRASGAKFSPSHLISRCKKNL